MDAVERIAAAGFDVAHAFDARAISTPGWERLAGGPRRGLLIGNTRALWPAFTAAMRDDALRAEEDPLDHYTERTITQAFPDAPVYFGHRRYDHAYLPLQPLAAEVGLGALAPSRLVIHPVYGPWFALRAVVLLDGDPPTNAPIPLPCACEVTAAPALARALAAPHDWRSWLAVRDSCELRAWRYSDEQIAYHYTKIWTR